MKRESIPILLHDALAVTVSWWLAYLLRFNFDIPTEYTQGMLQTLPVVLPVYLVIFLVARLERGLWRFASLPDVERILVAVAIGGVFVPAILAIAQFMVVVPPAVAILAPVLTFLIMSTSRLIYRRISEAGTVGASVSGRGSVIIFGAGSAASLLLRDMLRGADWHVAGLLDDDPIKKGRQLYGVTVLGPLADLAKQVKLLGVTQVVIAMPSASNHARQRAARLAAEAGVTVMTVPGMDDLLSGRVSVSQVRNVDPDELLSRQSVQLDVVRLRDFLTDRVVMVTGAGGSIGSELCRQIAPFLPRRLVLLEANEFAMYRLEQEFSLEFPDIEIVCAMGDVKDAERVTQVIRDHQPVVLFHAAAYKHVPLMEVNNSWEAVRNNVLGTLVVARAAVGAGVPNFVLVSTDKAVNPTNVMGATKRIAEMICQALQASSPSPVTKFSIVRFGNVLGSSGSVIPKFREQIANGGPITITHPDIVRYFMSIREAAQLVLQAGAIGQGGEIFVLDMGDPVKIVDLARNMIRLSGFGEDEIPIEFTGLRPGEKLFEEMLFDSESTGETPHPKLRIARARAVNEDFLATLSPWLQRVTLPRDEDVRRELKNWLPEYIPAVH
jgi:FlaA1/EpsC-like NDP-sugar epimerase